MGLTRLPIIKSKSPSKSKSQDFTAEPFDFILGNPFSNILKLPEPSLIQIRSSYRSLSTEY